MREFLVHGGSHTGSVVHIQHGRTYRFDESGEEYRVYSEPYGNCAGVLIPSDMTDNEAFAQIVRGLGDEAVAYFLGGTASMDQDPPQEAPHAQGHKPVSTRE